MSSDITAIILTKNEEKNIGDCIDSIRGIVDRIVVVDSFSTDDTVRIAKNYGAEVYQHPFESHAKQFQYAVDNAHITTLWTLRIDADERMTKDSSEELAEICLDNRSTDVNGVILRFKKNFLGKDLLHGGVYPWKKLSCYKTNEGVVEDRLMDEHIVLKTGRAIEMKHDCLHFDFKNLEMFIDKHNRYSTMETLDYYNYMMSTEEKKMDRKTRFKMKVYYRLPGGLRSYIYYIYRFYVKLGFLDGKEGRIYAFLQAYWYRFLVDAKIYEYTKKEI